jgi:hypothetical protein
MSEDTATGLFWVFISAILFGIALDEIILCVAIGAGIIAAIILSIQLVKYLGGEDG